MFLEFLAVFGVSKSYAIAASIAAVVRLLILSKQPPPPRPTPFEMLRQALITFIFVAAAEPVAVLLSIHESYASLIGIAVALHGTERVAMYVKDIMKVLLPEQLAKRIEEIDAAEEQKKIDATHQQIIEHMHELENTTDKNGIQNDDDKRE